jgi:putative ABC transport system substrate-binding protein
MGDEQGQAWGYLVPPRRAVRRGFLVDRRAFLGTLTGGLLAAPLAAGAQQAGRTYRLGYLSVRPPTTGPEDVEVFNAFMNKLRELGYVEGKNLIVESRFAENRPERFPDLAAELVRLNVDVILANTWTATEGAKRATTTVPIVMLTAVDPVATGLVASLAQPGGNITGVVDLTFDLGPKRLELLKEIVPRVSRIASLQSVGFVAGRLEEFLKTEEAAARSLGVTLTFFRVAAAEGLDGALAAIARGRFDALNIGTNPLNVANRLRIAEFALKNRLPSAHPFKSDVTAGGLFSYGADFVDRARRGAVYVDKVLQGARPAHLPVEQFSKFELVINLKTAKALGVTIPPALLQRADQVIE